MADFPYILDRFIPVIDVVLEGPDRRIVARFVIDTGSGLTIVDAPQIRALGYSESQSVGPFKTTSAVGIEHGYRLSLRGLEVFSKRFEGLEVAAMDLPRKYNVQGLIGMNILGQMEWCMHPNRQVISVAGAGR